MHIAIATSSLTSGHSARGTGIYTKHLIDALRTTQPSHTFTLFASESELPPKADVVHYPYFDPFFLTLPMKKKKPTVVTVHDLIPIAFASHFPKGIAGTVKWQIQKISLGQTAAIITDSAYSKRDIEKYIGYPPSSVHVVYLAPSDQMHQIKNQNEYRLVRKKYDIPGKYILYVGDINWNKNISGLLEAWAQIVQSSSEKIFLVLVGKAFVGEDIQEKRAILAKIHEFHLEENVLLLGHVPQEDMPLLYSAAALYIQPSYAEGFGLPVLEAMSCGCPVVSSRETSLAEIAGPSALVDPKNSQNMVRGIQTVLSYPLDKRNEVVKKGIEWSKQFSWEKVAQETVKVYDEVHASAHSSR